MAQNIQQQLKEVGSKLQNPPLAKDSLIKLLKQAATCLSELDQSPTKSIMESMEPLLNAIVKPELLKHQDREVKLLVATSVCEITRITAPEAPYDDEILKDIFDLIVSTFSGLKDTSGPSFGRRVVILETVARYRSCVVMLDLECDGLVKQMFSTFLSVASDDHPESVLTSMQTIMIVLLEESEEVPEDLLVVLLLALGWQKSGFTAAARRLAKNVVEQCAGKLEPGIKQCLISSMTRDSKSLNGEIDYHELIYNIYQCAPQILSGVVPHLTGELLTDNVDIRLKAVKLVGDLFSLPGSAIHEMFQPLFLEFLKRLTDRVHEVRMSVLERAKACLLSNPSRSEAPQILSSLCDRLLDYDENIRKQVVAVVCDVACHDLASVPVETVKLAAERLRDKSLLVKKYTLGRLAEIHRLSCVKNSHDSTRTDDFDWIPGKILRCFYDKDFRSDTIEPILCGSLFPSGFSVKERVKGWIRIFSGLDKVEIKALEKLLEQKQRLQQEMQRYLSLRQMHQESEVAEIQKKVMSCFRIMAWCFADPVKAESSFQILDQLKDANVWKILAKLLDPDTTYLHAHNYCDDLLKILGEKHRLFEFLSILSLKCSYMLFNKDQVKDILAEADLQKSGGNKQVTLAGMNILVILARYSPLLLSGIEEDLVHLLKEDDEVIKEGVLQVLAKAGGTIREQLGVSSSSLDLILERICLEGSRRQAKYAVHALAAITKDDGLMSLSVLYKRLVDMLEEMTHLPAVLQSLGCIAQAAMSIFETRESEIEEFIKENILNSSNKPEDQDKELWDDRTELCSLKIFGVKTLVKSYLPAKDAHLRVGVDSLLQILKNILLFGEISTDIGSSPVDKAHLKLAAAKAVLRLSRHWDDKIPLDLFHLTLRTSEIGFPQAKKQFLNKIHQYVKERLLDPKYALALLFDFGGYQKPDFEEAKRNLSDIIQTCQQGKARQLSAQSDSNSPVVYLEYVIPYMVHALAHYPSFPNAEECRDVKAFEPAYRQLHLFLSILLHGDEESSTEATSNNDKESISAVLSLLHSIKSSEDAADPAKSQNSHVLCDLGMVITKRLAKKKDDLQEVNVSVPLPPLLYKPREAKEGDDTVVNEGHTWLTDEGVLSQFDSLKLEVNGKIHPAVAEDEVKKDDDSDGNDIPLGKILKHLKAKSSKAKRGVKGSTLTGGSKKDDDIDVLRVVREIDLDSVGISNKFESSNGHQYDTLRTTLEHNIEENKRSVGSETSSRVPKRQRSSSQGSHKFPHTKNTSDGPKKTPTDSTPPKKKLSSESPESDDEVPDYSGDKMVLRENIVKPNLLTARSKNNSNSSKRKRKTSGMDHTVKVHKDVEVKELDMKPDKFVESEHVKQVNGSKSSTGTSKKRKRKSIAGLAKCTSKQGGSETMDLINCRINIWWPMDKQFYSGVVKSYDPEKEKHVVLYDDGDVEVLNLNKEKWEFVDSGQKAKKRSKASKSTPQKKLSSEPKKKSTSKLLELEKKSTSKSSELKKKIVSSPHESKLSVNISPSPKLRGRRTPRKNSMSGQKSASKRKISFVLMNADDGGSPGVSNTGISEDNEMKSGALDEDRMEITEKNLRDGDESEMKSASEGTLDGDSKNDRCSDEEANSQGKKSKPSVRSPSDIEEGSDEEVGSDSGKKLPNAPGGGCKEEETEHSDSEADEPETKPGRSGKMVLPSNNAKTDNSDDETLGVWKRRVGKAGKKK